MKIADIVGSYADGAEMAPDNSLLQTIANAFTRSGKVKSPLNQQLPDGQPIGGHVPFSSVGASGADPVADAVSKDSSYSRRVSTYSCSSPQKSVAMASPQKSVAMAAAYNSVYYIL